MHSVHCTLDAKFLRVLKREMSVYTIQLHLHNHYFSNFKFFYYSQGDLASTTDSATYPLRVLKLQ